jgi:hypothetical protein
VLVRYQPVPLPDSHSRSKEDQYIAGELQAVLYAFLHSLEAPVINRPPRGVSHRTVVATVERASSILETGFWLPRVLAASDITAAADFQAACGPSILVRPPSGWQPWRLLAGPEAAAELEALVAQRTLFLQELPAGQWRRVYVAGERCFGVAGETPGSAGSNAPRPVRRTGLSPDLQQRCQRLARLLELEYAQIDMVQTDGGDLYCLDVSAWPDLEPCGPELQRTIARALADRFAGKEKRGSDDPGFRHAGRHRDSVRLLAPVIPAS